MAKNQNNNVAPATQKTEPGAKKDALATALAQIEKQFGKGAIMKLGDNTAMQVDAISTGSLGLDLALGVGGVPRGRIIEVFGPESSGKTTLALHILAEAQKKGGEVEEDADAGAGESDEAPVKPARRGLFGSGFRLSNREKMQAEKKAAKEAEKAE